ncbi:Uncharacterised protein [Mycobacteroides abscessus subsp. abscessus]|nr:Uncharacterised protein [Mycobacteroides abscessus subsp. abscessus]
MTTHDWCPASPRSATTVGRAVATMVPSSAASSIPSRTATKIRLRRCTLIMELAASWSTVPDSAECLCDSAGMTYPC